MCPIAGLCHSCVSQKKHGGRSAGPHNTHLRRALPNHRIIPKETSQGHQIKLVHDIHLLPSGCKDDEPAMGAALFPNVAIRWSDEPLKTRALESTVAKEKLVLEAQVSGAYSQETLAAVWPELCMPTERLRKLSQALKSRAGKLEPKVGPKVVAAGSWHEGEDGAIENVMHILDHSGRDRLTFTKITTFAGGHYVEANEPGDVIPILVSRDVLISFAICSDFCIDAAGQNPFIDLDVDLVVVPSLGTASAAKGHQSNLSTRSQACGGATFIVQQREPSAAGSNVGWVVHDPKMRVAPRENAAWSVRKISLK